MEDNLCEYRNMLVAHVDHLAQIDLPIVDFQREHRFMLEKGGFHPSPTTIKTSHSLQQGHSRLFS